MRTSNSLSSLVKHIHKQHPFQSIKKSLAHFFSKVSRVKNSQADFATQPCKFYKVFSNNYITQSQQKNQTGFISHFGPRQEPALVLHGNKPDSKLGPGIIYYKGSCIDYKNAAGQKAVHKLLNVHDFVEIAFKDYGLDLRRGGNTGDGPLHLICCYAGGFSPKSMAGEMARELKRSIVCYGIDKPVTTFPGLRSGMEETSKVFCEEIFLNRKVLSPLYEIIHLPDNQPGEIRV